MAQQGTAPGIQQDKIQKLREALRKAQVELSLPSRKRGLAAEAELEYAVRNAQLALDQADPAGYMARRRKEEGGGSRTATQETTPSVQQGPSQDVPEPPSQNLLPPEEPTQEQTFNPALAGVLRGLPGPDQEPASPPVQASETGVDPVYQSTPDVPAEASFNRALRAEAAATRKPAGDVAGGLQAGADAEMQDIQERQKRLITQKFISDFEFPPSEIKTDPNTGEMYGAFSEQDYKRAMNRWKLRQEVGQAKRLQQINEGGGPAEQRQAERDRFATEQKLLTDELQRRRTEDAAAAKQKAEEEKQRVAYELDSAPVIMRASGDKATPEQRAFAAYFQDTQRGLPGEGMDEALLQRAAKGAIQLSNVFQGVGNESFGESTGSTGERRNRSQFIVEVQKRLQADLAKVSSRRQQTAIAQTEGPAAPPTTDAQTPQDYVTTFGGSTQQNIGAQIVGNPAASEINPVGPGFMTQASNLLNNNFMAGPLPSYRTSQMGMLPTTPSAQQGLQQVLSNNSALSRVAAALMFGSGSDTDRKKLMDYLTRQTGMDPNQFVLRQSIYNDDKWRQMVQTQVIDQLQRYSKPSAK